MALLRDHKGWGKSRLVDDADASRYDEENREGRFSVDTNATRIDLAVS
jgi:hypothetical protein